MGPTIRPSTAADAPQWLVLLQGAFGNRHPSKELYDAFWVAGQLDPGSGHETLVAESDGRLTASISLLKPDVPSDNPVANVGRILFSPESLADGTAMALVQSISQMADQRNQMAVARISAVDNTHQALFENLGYSCVGYQPLKHLLDKRVGVLFYVRGASSVLVNRLPLSESLPHVAELASAVLENLQIRNPLTVRDGATGYPLEAELKIHDASADDYELWRMQALGANPTPEISGRFNLGFGQMRVPAERIFRALLAQKEEKMVAGLCYYFDEQDRCVRIIDGFCCDDSSMGAIMSHALKNFHSQQGAVYCELDVLATAPRMLKSAEQLGFVPVAYLPAFFRRADACADVVKMVKLSLAYVVDATEFTKQARTIVEIINHNFEDQKLGLAIINLLRPLSMFGGLGDGELRKIARLFVQKLYRPGDQIFARGDSSNEAYIVLRGRINIQLERASTPVAQLTDGKIFGEMAFLDGSPRGAYASAAQPSILVVVQRSAFADLVRREPGLGMVVMRNIASDLAVKLRNVNEFMAAARVG
jgi:CRP/FNR family transcriptional regulator, cyclic AMP receptor protein